MDRPIYALPRRLIAGINQSLPRWWTLGEQEFEERLTEFCDGRGAIGAVRTGCIRCLLLQPLAMPAVSGDEYADMGWDKQVKFESVKLALELGEDRLAPFRRQSRAYLGWLLTNPEYLADLQRVHRSRPRQRLFNLRERGPGNPPRGGMGHFLTKWRLAGMSSWDLPVPDGPNLSGIRAPGHTGMFQTKVVVEMPVTMALSTRYPLRETIDDARRVRTPAHLAEWRDVLERRRGTLSPASFEWMFEIRLWMYYALERRYPGRLRGHLKGLDGALSHYLGLKTDQIRKLRHAIARRLRAGPTTD